MTTDHLTRILLGFQPRAGLFVVQVEGAAHPLLTTSDPTAAIRAIGLSALSRRAAHASRRALRALKSRGVDL